ncbi:MAG: dTMP kinase [bacterium]
MRKRKGLFVVLEGIDGAGTTTQAKLLHAYLDNRGIRSVITNEPTDEPVGKLIRDALSGRVTSPQTGERVEFSEAALCLLFAADRLEHSAAIESQRSRGQAVVCDRYIHSSIAYQTLDSRITPQRVIDVNNGCSIPDVTFFLKVPVGQCLKRLQNRKDVPTVYEKKEFLENISRNYEETERLYEKTFGPIVSVDGTASPENVHAAIVDGLSGYLID